MYILALDDERYALESLACELKIVFPEANIKEETKASSAIAWAKELAEENIDLTYAFLDIQIRGTNGIDVARQLKQLHPGVILFFCTAHSEYAIDAFGLYAKGYLLKPVQAQDIERVLNEMVEGWRKNTGADSHRLRIQTFGNFAVFVKDVPVSFEREKAKELLAYLVDRHGSPVTTEQIAITLWENEVYDRKLKNKTTTTISSLRSTLRELGMEDVLVKTWNHLALDISKVQCDAYDFEKGDMYAVNSFRGEYMVNYSWAELTTGHYTMLDERRGQASRLTELHL
ncbi:MAG: response regulator [Lachnospiraceae bacterium]|nr:response regulator [Lachnospiraceae bacterium]